jgi:hypothetical protein
VNLPFEQRVKNGSFHLSEVRILSRTTKVKPLLSALVKLISGDGTVLEQKINDLMPEYEILGDLVWDGKLFWQKMVKA